MATCEVCGSALVCFCPKCRGAAGGTKKWARPRKARRQLALAREHKRIVQAKRKP